MVGLRGGVLTEPFARPAGRSETRSSSLGRGFEPRRPHCGSRLAAMPPPNQRTDQHEHERNQPHTARPCEQAARAAPTLRLVSVELVAWSKSLESGSRDGMPARHIGDRYRQFGSNSTAGDAERANADDHGRPRPTPTTRTDGGGGEDHDRYGGDASEDPRPTASISGHAVVAAEDDHAGPPDDVSHRHRASDSSSVRSSSGSTADQSTSTLRAGAAVANPTPITATGTSAVARPSPSDSSALDRLDFSEEAGSDPVSTRSAVPVHPARRTEPTKTPMTQRRRDPKFVTRAVCQR